MLFEEAERALVGFHSKPEQQPLACILNNLSRPGEVIQTLPKELCAAFQFSFGPVQNV